MRYYFYIIRNNANCFYSKKVKLGESPFVDCPNKDFTDVARYSDKSKADKVAEQLNKTFGAFQHRVKDRFFSVRKSIVIEDAPKVVEVVEPLSEVLRIFPYKLKPYCDGSCRIPLVFEFLTICCAY